MSVYPGTRNAREYAAGFDDGRLWAAQDLDAGATAYWLDTLQGECATFRDVGSRGVRAYYLGALRGYRESVRTLQSGKVGNMTYEWLVSGCRVRHTREGFFGTVVDTSGVWIVVAWDGTQTSPILVPRELLAPMAAQEVALEMEP